MVSDREKHWNKVYEKGEITRLGWYEEKAEQSLGLINTCGLHPSDCILDVGSGATTLLGSLLRAGYENIIATDLSAVALETAKKRLGADLAARVRWVVTDITSPENLAAPGEIALWHDRAVLHFLTEEEQRQAYLHTLREVVRPEGYVIIAAFSLDGAKKCSGLDVYNYDAAMLTAFLGSDFELKKAFDYIYHQPSGAARPFIYTLFRRLR